MSCNGQRFVTGGNINSDRQTGGHMDEVQSYSSTLGTLEYKKNQYLLTQMSLLYLPLTKLPLQILVVALDCQNP